MYRINTLQLTALIALTWLKANIINSLQRTELIQPTELTADKADLAY